MRNSITEVFIPPLQENRFLLFHQILDMPNFMRAETTTIL
jgi:hypothetical protein